MCLGPGLHIKRGGIQPQEDILEVKEKVHECRDFEPDEAIVSCLFVRDKDWSLTISETLFSNREVIQGGPIGGKDTNKAMHVLFLTLIVVGKVTSLPLPMVPKSKFGIGLSRLTACEVNMQVHCINKYGTAEYLRGTNETACNVRKLVDCLTVEKSKEECRLHDYGTVYYIDAFLRNVDVTKCMDDFDFYEVQQIFQTPSPKNIHELSNTHRTTSSGDHETTVHWHGDNEVDSVEHSFGESGSGQF